MKPDDPNAVEDTDSPDHNAFHGLDAYPAGANHDDLLLCGPENDTQWIMSDLHVDLQEVA